MSTQNKDNTHNMCNIQLKNKNTRNFEIKYNIDALCFQIYNFLYLNFKITVDISLIKSNLIRIFKTEFDYLYFEIIDSEKYESVNKILISIFNMNIDEFKQKIFEFDKINIVENNLKEIEKLNRKIIELEKKLVFSQETVDELRDSYIKLKRNTLKNGNS